MVLHLRQQDLIARREVGAAPALGHQVDALGGAAGEDHLVRVLGTEVARQPLAGFVIQSSGLGAQVIDAPMDIGVGGLVELALGLEHRQRLLAGGGTVEIHQRLAVSAGSKDREVVPDVEQLGRSAARRLGGWSNGWHCHSESRLSRSCTSRSNSSRTGCSATSATTSAAKAWVSNRRADAAGMPRLRA